MPLIRFFCAFFPSEIYSARLFICHKIIQISPHQLSSERFIWPGTGKNEAKVTNLQQHGISHSVPLCGEIKFRCLLS
jgi:hypothetical protein